MGKTLNVGRGPNVWNEEAGGAKSQARHSPPRPRVSSTVRRAGRPKNDDDRANARERLLDAAHALMCELSTIDVPVIEIANRAQLNVALINYYFGSKDGLLLQLAMRHQSSYAAVLEKLLGADFTAAKKLTLHIGGMVRAFRRVPYLQRLQHKILRDSSEQAALECGSALIRPLVSFYRKLAAQGLDDGSLRPVDPMHLYMTVVGSCDFLYSASASLARGFSIAKVDDTLAENYISHLVSVILYGLGARADDQ